MSELEDGARDGSRENGSREDGLAKELPEIQTFGEGDYVVYPSHGAGCICGTEEREIAGEVRRYYIVDIPDTGLTLSIPAGISSGLRACVGEESILEALGVLGDGASEMPSNWNHRLKHNREKIRSGEIIQVAEVVRNLNVYNTDHGLSTGERTMLLKARQILVSEVAMVRAIEASEAESLVDGALSPDGKDHK